LTIASALVLAACAPPSDLPRGENAVWDLVIIGDSSLWELGEAYAAQIETDVGVQVVLHDFANEAGSAGELLEVLRTKHSANSRLEGLPDILRDAEVVVVFLNPEDSVTPGAPLDLSGCFLYSAPGPCRPESFAQWTEDLKSVWGEILELRNGQPTILRATDLYNPLVSPWTEHGIFESCTQCWETMSEAARLAAEAYGVPFLSRFDAFNGPNHDVDPRQKGYIVDDGEHPSEMAAQYTAELLSQMGYDAVPEP
jgi:hypothetical protein